MIFPALASITVALILYRYIKDWMNYGHIPGPSGITSLPMFGHAYMIGKGKPLLDTVVKLADKYGPVFRFDVGGTPTIFVGDLNALGEAYKKDEFLGKPFLGNEKISQVVRSVDPDGNRPGVFVSTGKIW